MSDKLPVETKKSEELDLVILFNLIGKSFKKLFNSIIDLFKGLRWLIIVILKPIVDNLRLLAVLIVASAILGFFINNLKKPIYYSEMIVKPYFESKYKLFNSVNYFNGLIETKNINELVRIFEIDSSDAASLIDFKISKGPESPNELLIEYDAYLKELDTSMASQVKFDDYLNNRDILSSRVFSVQARAFKHDVFLNLEKGFQKTFENPYSKKLMKIRDETIQVKKDAFMIQLRRLDSLQGIYFNLLKEESKNDNLSMGSDLAFPIQLQRTQTREFELFQEELRVRNILRDLDQELIEDSIFYDIVASFEQEGSRDNSFFSNYLFLFPVISFSTLALAFILINTYNYIKNYEA